MKILIVEDRPDVLNDLRDILLMEEYEVFIGRNGLEGLRVMETATPDLVITDLWMPEMDGETMIKEIRVASKFDLVPILIFSAQYMDMKKVRALGATELILKPVDPAILLEVIKKVTQTS